MVVVVVDDVGGGSKPKVPFWYDDQPRYNYFEGFWDVHRRNGALTHCHVAVTVAVVDDDGEVGLGVESNIEISPAEDSMPDVSIVYVFCVLHLQRWVE